MLQKQGKQLVVGRWRLLAAAAGKNCAHECWLDPVDIEVLRKMGLGKYLKTRKPAGARMSHVRRTTVFRGGR